ncbi:precorrin-2 dehydrogenase/sirohydrochlorin ferrochelatase [Natranaerovirga pectinivora]|uniref:precorrin-2 dehydrogenase n=1 Tax=Natranaerovirga pectinivora TaxID=682400 RepID=A0A4R3MNI6_9FIRM|nr:bifunctional precorrin-2 dehydrogenase/sirohydrochlorin ferrochelatase [Natranaerovirga pectinivora]TCT14249.1 precorrin-2 dehydrogenase/sirohydrochlorin ferrochelatase [Natranaerovirga pectinivora]
MYFPIMLNIKDKNVLIIGAGNVAFHKAKKLLACECHLKVVSYFFTKEFLKLENIEFIKDHYNKGYLQNNYMVIAATDNKDLNNEIYRDALELGILCSVVSGGASDFILPASFNRGDLSISVSTNGKSPSLSKRIVRDLKCVYDESYEEKVDLLGQIREEMLLSEEIPENEKKFILNEMVNFSVEELRIFAKKMFEGV